MSGIPLGYYDISPSLLKKSLDKSKFIILSKCDTFTLAIIRLQQTIILGDTFHSFV